MDAGQLHYRVGRLSCYQPPCGRRKGVIVTTQINSQLPTDAGGVVEAVAVVIYQVGVESQDPGTTGEVIWQESSVVVTLSRVAPVALSK